MNTSPVSGSISSSQAWQPFGKVGGAAEDPLASSPVLHLGPELDDFDDTATVLAQCDLVISADTSVAHLAGALGRPLWVLLPYAADWRWTAAGERSPWYPSARLFRQAGPGDWDDVVTDVLKALPAAF